MTPDTACAAAQICLLGAQLLQHCAGCAALTSSAVTTAAGGAASSAAAAAGGASAALTAAWSSGFSDSSPTRPSALPMAASVDAGTSDLRADGSSDGGVVRQAASRLLLRCMHAAGVSGAEVESAGSLASPGLPGGGIAFGGAQAQHACGRATTQRSGGPGRRGREWGSAGQSDGAHGASAWQRGAQRPLATCDAMWRAPHSPSGASTTPPSLDLQTWRHDGLRQAAGLATGSGRRSSSSRRVRQPVGRHLHSWQRTLGCWCRLQRERGRCEAWCAQLLWPGRVRVDRRAGRCFGRPALLVRWPRRLAEAGSFECSHS